ncbi:RICIN domain-containing protein [Streptomyces chartreusis]|uniref:RICIN domain-containing protein n=1 Tax=Streptomyces chartreusis TaxID=1969 RepID=UPI00340FDFB5
MTARSSRKIASLILGFMVALGLVITGSSPAAAVQEDDPMHRPPAGAVYKFMLAHANFTNGSQLMLAQLEAGTNVTSNNTGHYSYSHGNVQDASQAWEWIPETAGHSITDGWGQLRNRFTGQCLDVEGSSTADYQYVIGWTCNGGDNQKFKAVNLGGGGLDFKIVAKHSNKPIGPAYNCLSSNGQVMSQLPATSSDCQKWRIERTSYRFATEDIRVGQTWYAHDTDEYHCVPGYSFRWHYDGSQENPDRVYYSDEPGTIHGGDNVGPAFSASGDEVYNIYYENDGTSGYRWGQIYLFCQPD